MFCLAIGRDPKGMTIAVVNEEMAGAGCGAWSEGCLITSDMKELDMDTGWDEDWDAEEAVTVSAQGFEGGTNLERAALMSLAHNLICEPCGAN